MVSGRTPVERSTAPALSAPHAARWKFLLENVRKLQQAGIPVTCGTDAGMAGTYHGYSTLHELELLVTAGLSPMDALIAGTRTSAYAAGLEGDRGTIAPGKLADLLLVDGQPDQHIEDIEKTAAVFLGGKQLDLAALRDSIASRGLTPLPVIPVPAGIDDMENADRTSIGTLRVDGTDEGTDHSRLMFEPIVKEGADHSLMLEAALAAKQRPYVRLELPLTPGGFDVTDISGYHGITFLARGQCACRVLMNTYNIRNQDFFAAPFVAAGSWATVKIPFSMLHARNAQEKWDPRSMRILMFEVGGPAGSKAWLELDKVAFY
jgi:hypothetical protein